MQATAAEDGAYQGLPINGGRIHTKPGEVETQRGEK